MKWSDEFYAWRAGDGCPACAEGRPEATDHGVRFFAGERCDAYPVRADIQRGLAIAVRTASVTFARASSRVLPPTPLGSGSRHAPKGG